MSVIISWIWKQLTDNSKSLSKIGFYLVLLQRNALIEAFIVQGDLEHTFTTILPLSSNQTNTQGGPVLQRTFNSLGLFAQWN